jgi:hypothetical protein
MAVQVTPINRGDQPWGSTVRHQLSGINHQNPNSFFAADAFYNSLIWPG